MIYLKPRVPNEVLIKKRNETRGAPSLPRPVAPLPPSLSLPRTDTERLLASSFCFLLAFLLARLGFARHREGEKSCVAAGRQTFGSPLDLSRVPNHADGGPAWTLLQNLSFRSFRNENGARVEEMNPSSGKEILAFILYAPGIAELLQGSLTCMNIKFVNIGVAFLSFAGTWRTSFESSSICMCVDRQYLVTRSSSTCMCVDRHYLVTRFSSICLCVDRHYLGTRN